MMGDAPSEQTSGNKSRREVWIAGVSQMGLRAKTPEQMVEKIMEILKQVVKYNPDFVCLPEAFPFEYIEAKLSFAQKVEVSDKVLSQFAEFSKQNNCYTICPVFTCVRRKNL